MEAAGLLATGERFGHLCGAPVIEDLIRLGMFGREFRWRAQGKPGRWPMGKPKPNIPEIGNVIGLLKSIHGDCVDEEPYEKIREKLNEAIAMLYNIRKGALSCQAS